MRQKKERKINFSIVFSSVIILMMSVFALLLINNKPVESFNPVDLKVAQYSDRNITENAIIKDSKFEHISFTSPSREKKFYPNQLASVFRAFKWLFEESASETEEKEYGTWIWTPTFQITDEYANSILSDLRKHGINAVYLSVDSYLDIFVLPEGEEKNRKLEQFSDILENFIKTAGEKGIVVDAEAGWQNWAEEGHRYKAFAVVDFVKKFNENRKYKFRGFQYDVEPYLLSDYKTDSGKVLKNFTELVDQTSFFLKLTDLKFSVVIPDFYDKRDGHAPVFSYNGRRDSAFRHLLNILEEKNGNSVIIMSYRNFAYGRDGSIEVSANEMKTARRGRFSTNIIIAQETSDVPPPYITFHNTSKSYFLDETNKLYRTFDSYKNFGGVAIHYANAFLSLKPI